MAVSQEEHLRELTKGYRFGWSDPDHSIFTPKKGLSAAVVEEISARKSEPDWMRKARLKALRHFQLRPMPWWGADLSGIDFDDIYYFIRSTEKQAQNWEDLPDDIKGTWDKLGIPEAEKKYLGGVSAQYESEVVYHKIREELDHIGVIFTDMDSALRDYPDLVKVYNLVTKRAAAYEDAVMEWIDGNIGSKVTMKYPSIYLLGKGARGEVLSVAFAGEGMHTDAGAKAIHAAPYTSSVITSKSVSKGGGRTGYRGLVRVEPGAHHAKSIVRCDALILDEQSRSDTYPYVEVEEETAQLGHEASVSRVGEDQLFYLMSRGLTEAEATAMVVNGFIEPITRELPMEYAVELNRLIELQMEGAIG